MGTNAQRTVDLTMPPIQTGSVAVVPSEVDGAGFRSCTSDASTASVSLTRHDCCHFTPKYSMRTQGRKKIRNTSKTTKDSSLSCHSRISDSRPFNLDTSFATGAVDSRVSASSIVALYSQRVIAQLINQRPRANRIYCFVKCSMTSLLHTTNPSSTSRDHVVVCTSTAASD
ncbi:hypothetical protein BC828DRAFT_204310 [Blastocladiella britannica]|nr:hypothetical protein BC828DRAFT_204310 [Blastocladiella britannica]